MKLSQYIRPNRRNFIASSVAAVAGLTNYNHLYGRDFPSKSDDISNKNIERNAALINFGLNSLRDTQVSYADIRISSNRTRSYLSGRGFTQSEAMAVSIRVLVEGYWGFACSPICTEAEVTRLVTEAVSIARYNSLGPKRYVDLGPPVVGDSGEWETPVTIDPFAVHPDEVNDFLNGLGTMMVRYPGITTARAKASFTERQMWFGSTEERVLHQKRVVSSADVAFVYQTYLGDMKGYIDTVSTASLGWEYLTDQPLRELFEKELEDVKFDISLPVKPIDVGRYNVVFDAASSGGLVKSTIGDATILSRIAGYHANDTGTSFIVDPVESQNSLKVASSLLNVVSSRNDPGGPETVKWDAEGVPPVDVNIISNGIVSDYTTSREMEGWLRSQSGQPESLRVSTGSTDATTAIHLPKSTLGNIKVLPGAQQADFLDLISHLGDGLAMKRMLTTVDFQCLNGLSRGGICYEIKKGKRVGRFANHSLMFRTPELFTNILSIGGAQSLFRSSNVTSVPMHIKDCTIIDITRKA